MRPALFAPVLATTLAVTLVAGVPFAAASSSDWAVAVGGRIRLVTAGMPDASGQLSGMLEIDLAPGWKTYWQDPGDAGVPPQIDVSSQPGVRAQLAFPAPQRHDESGTLWAGYDRPVALPVTFSLDGDAAAKPITANVFLGVCETICVPVQATLIVDPRADPDNADDAALVAAAQAALPAPAHAEFEARGTPGGDAITVEAWAPEATTEVDLFVAGSEGYTLGQPQRRIEEGGKLGFTVPVIDRPAAIPSGPGLAYTLVSGAQAVSGFLPYP